MDYLSSIQKPRGITRYRGNGWSNHTDPKGTITTHLNRNMPANYRTCFFFIFAYLICLHASAQIKTLSKHYTTADGLSDNRITSIIKDKDGFMWFGSWVGISRFDGNKFSIFKSYPGDHSPLNSNRVDHIVEDPQGRYLWVKVYDNHIYRFDKHTESFSDLSTLLADSLIRKEVFTRILSVKDNLVWLASRSSGIILITNAAGQKPGYLRFGKDAKAEFQLPSNEIVFFKVDKFKNLWVGTDEGICLFKYLSHGKYKKMLMPSSLSGISFAGITQGNEKMWLATTDGKLISTDHSLKAIRLYNLGRSALNHVLISKISRDIYTTTSTGELILITKNGRSERLIKMADGSELSHIHEDKNGILWIESGSFGLLRFDPHDHTVQNLLPKGRYRTQSWKRSSAFFEDKQGILWVNNRENGLMYYNADQKRLKVFAVNPELNSGELTNNYTRLYYDTTGVLWTGSGHNGIQKIVFQEPNFRQQAPKHKSIIRSENEVRGIYGDKRNRLWFGTKAGELYVYKDRKRMDNLLPDMPKTPAGIYSILQDRKGRVWLGTKSAGLIKAEPLNAEATKYKTTHYSGSDADDPGTSRTIYCLLEDRKGRLWAGSYEDGLIQVKEKDGKTTFNTIKNFFHNYPKGNYKRIRHMAEDGKGRIWIGTTDGLLIFDPEESNPAKQSFRIVQKEHGSITSLGGNDVQYIFRDSRKNMWVLTSAGGLNLAVEEENGKIRFLNYSKKDGLPSDGLVSCQEDSEGNLWIATQNGISKFILKDRSFRNFNHNDGIHEATLSEASSTKMKDGTLVYGTAFGFLSFDPAEVLTHQNPAKLAFTTLYINSEELTLESNSPLKSGINYTNELVLNYNQNGIGIEFSVLEYRSPNGQNFATRLRGFDDVWRNTEGQKRATYTNLPPGDYIFEVKCLNDELFTEVPTRSLKITILPPFWKTWWAYLIYLFLALIAFFVIRKITISFLKLRENIKVERRLAELKLNFFTQISHELRTPLTLIMNPSEEVLHSEKLSNKGREYMRVVVKNAHRMVRLVNQVLDLRKVQSGNVILHVTELEIRSFILALVEYFKETIENQNITVNITTDEPEIRLWADADKLEIILYNVIANAIKFSPQNSAITISIQQEVNSNSIKIEVSDEGPGVKNTELDDIFKLYYEGDQLNGKALKGSGIGLALTRELIQLHSGKIKAMNNAVRGLSIIIELKSGKEHFDVKTTRFMTAPQVLNGSEAENYEISVHDTAPLGNDLPTVLIVEDHDDLRTFLANKLSDYYNVETAHDGEAAIKKAIDLGPDLVLSDIMMPGMNGIQLLDKLKSTPSTSHIPVVLLTARHSIESEIEGLQYGADYYLTKPIKIDLLKAALKNILTQRQRLFQNLLKKQPEPLQEKSPAITPYDKEFLQRVIQVVEEKLHDIEFNIDYVSESLGMSRSAFFKKLKSLTDLAPVEFVREIRLQKAKEIFDAGEVNISTVSYQVGFNNPKYFSTCFKSRFNQSPSEYLKSLKQVTTPHPTYTMKF